MRYANQPEPHTPYTSAEVDLDRVVDEVFGVGAKECLVCRCRVEPVEPASVPSASRASVLRAPAGRFEALAVAGRRGLGRVPPDPSLVRAKGVRSGQSGALSVALESLVSYRSPMEGGGAMEGP